MTTVETGSHQGPPADAEAFDVLDALVRAGRWADAAEYYARAPEGNPRDHAALLISAGRFDDAHHVIDAAEVDEEWAHWDAFVRLADVVVRGDAVRFPDLVAASQNFGWHWCTAIMMVRIADEVRRPEVAASFARTVLAARPWDVTAATVLALALVDKGDYPAAVKIVGTADLGKRADEPSAVELAVRRLHDERSPQAARAFATIGHFANRPKDATTPVSAPLREMRQRWHAAWRAHAPSRWPRVALGVLIVAGAITASILVLGNAVLGEVAVVAGAALVRARPMAGLDARTSRIVRSMSGPMSGLRSRRYVAADVLVWLVVFMASMSAVLRLVPRAPSSFVWALTVVCIAVASGATAARRGWIRDRNQRLRRADLDPARCRCLDNQILRGRDSRLYVTQHLFDSGGVPGQPSWRVVQCLETFARFVDLPDALLTVKLPPRRLDEHSLR